MLTSLLQIGSLMSRTTFCEKLKVTQNGDFHEKLVMMLTSLLQIGSLMSWTIFCEKLKVDQNGVVL